MQQNFKTPQAIVDGANLLMIHGLRGEVIITFLNRGNDFGAIAFNNSHEFNHLGLRYAKLIKRVANFMCCDIELVIR